MKSLDYIKVILMDLPPTVHGFTVCDGFDFYTITINSRLSHKMQVDTYWHELSHIFGKDFSRMQDINRDLLEDTNASNLEAKRHK